MMNRRLLLLLISALTITAMLPAGQGGSTYSRFGIGDIAYPGTGRSIGMGGAHLALLTVNDIDQMNPAGWARINFTRFHAGAMYEGYSVDDGRSTAYYGGTKFDGFMLAIPISTSRGIVFGAGIVPYSRVNYNVVSPASKSGLTYTLQYLGDGGLSLGQAGFSWSLLHDLHIGGKLNYYFGTLHNQINQTFTSDQYTNADLDRASRLRGIGSSWGVIYSGFRNFLPLPESGELSVGFLLTTTSYLSLTEERLFSYTTGSVTTGDTTERDGGKVTVPYAIGAGIAYTTDRLAIAGDFHYQKWDRFRFGKIRQPEIRDSYRIALGAEWIPRRESFASFLERAAYRLGGSYHSTYYSFRGTDINEIGITGGMGFSIVGDTRLNIGAQYVFRGTTDDGLQKDRILRISFMITGSELWFQRPPEE